MEINQRTCHRTIIVRKIARNRINMRRRYLLIILLVSVFSTACSLPILIPNRTSKVIKTYDSPHNSDRISTIRTHMSATIFFPGTQHIDLRVKLKDRSFLFEDVYQEIDIFGEKGYPFEIMFPWIGWTSKNSFVLKLGRDTVVERQINIRNLSAKTIDAVMIFADDIYLITTVEAGSEFNFPIRWSGDAASKCSLNAMVYFADGHKIPRNYSDNRFSLNTKTNEEFLNGEVEKNEDCVDGEIIVRNKRIEYIVAEKTVN